PNGVRAGSTGGDGWGSVCCARTTWRTAKTNMPDAKSGIKNLWKSLFMAYPPFSCFGGRRRLDSCSYSYSYSYSYSRPHSAASVDLEDSTHPTDSDYKLLHGVTTRSMRPSLMYTRQSPKPKTRLSCVTTITARSGCTATRRRRSITVCP